MSGFFGELGRELRGIVGAVHDGDAPASSLLSFLEREMQTDSEDGAWSLRDHEAFGEIIELLERVATLREANATVTVVKAEQVGFSTLALGFAVWLAAERHYNTGYFFPNDAFASEWGMSKLNPLIAESEYLSALAADAPIERGVLKQFHGKSLYFLGLAKISGATSRPMDAQLSDEVDLTSESIRKWKRGRMRHSKLRFELDFSAPYAQNSGIDKRYQDGSQRRRLFRCISCGKDDICLEESFPDCMQAFNGTWIRVCPACNRKLDLVANARWVPTYPERETKDRNYSYRISALSIPAIDGNEIMRSYHKALDSGDPDEMAIFNRTVRAFADAGSMQPIDDAALRRMERDYALKVEPTGNPIFFGSDAGNACWIWFEELLPTGQRRIVWIEKIHSDRYVDRVSELIRRFNPRFGILDKKPLLESSRKIAYTFPRQVALLDFASGSELQLVEERIVLDDTTGAARQESGPTYWCVKVDRNAALSRFCGAATHADKGLLISNERTRQMELVREHLKKLQKVADHSASGNVIHRFLDNVENHLGMCGMAAHLARLVAPDHQPFKVTNVETEPAKKWGLSRRDKWSLIRGRS